MTVALRRLLDRLAGRLRLLASASAVLIAIGLVVLVLAQRPADSELARPSDAPAPTGDTGDPASGDGLGATSSTLPTRREVTLAFTGDTLPHTAVVTRAQVIATGGQPFDFRPMFREVESYLANADLALCHLEVPLSPDNRRLSSYPVFNAPRQVADALAGAGYDGCSTASNHSLDKGFDGIVDTLQVLDETGLAHAGTARSAFEGAAPRLYRAGDFVVGHVSGTYGLNGFTKPADKPWSVDLWDADLMLERAAAARRAGADIVVVSVHWGVEYLHEPTADQRALAEALTASPDVDLVIGHHAHVLQPIERVGGKVVVYGLGNFLSNQSEACCPAASSDGAIVLITLRGDPDGPPGSLDTTGVRYVPTWVDRSTFTIRSVPDGLNAGENGPLAASWRRTVSVLSRFPDVAQPLFIPTGYDAPGYEVPGPEAPGAPGSAAR